MLLPALGRPRVLAPAPLRLPLAFLHEAFLRSADKRPSLPTAFAWQVSRLHFFKKLALAAPASGLPSLLTALLPQVSCANAKVKFSDSTKAASKMRFIWLLLRYESAPSSRMGVVSTTGSEVYVSGRAWRSDRTAKAPGDATATSGVA